MKPENIDYSLYLVTDRGLSRGITTQRIVEAPLRGGVTCVQLREKTCSTREFIAQALSIKEHLKRQIDFYFDQCSAVQMVKEEFGDVKVKHLYHEIFLANPKGYLKKLCNFLGVDYTEDYLKDCADIVYKSPNKSRLSVDWSNSSIDLVINRMADFQWMQGYFCGTR